MASICECFGQNARSFMQSSGEEILRKRAVCTDFQVHCRKSAETAFKENMLPRYWTKKLAFPTVLVILSTFHMVFTETNPQEQPWRAANDFL